MTENEFDGSDDFVIKFYQRKKCRRLENDYLLEDARPMLNETKSIWKPFEIKFTLANTCVLIAAFIGADVVYEKLRLADDDKSTTLETCD